MEASLTHLAGSQHEQQFVRGNWFSKQFWRQTRVKPWKLILVGGAILIAIALGVALGVYLSGGAPPSAPSNVTSNFTSTNATNGLFWFPPYPSTEIELARHLTNTTFNASICDINLLHHKATINTVPHNQGRKAICYFSAGIYEN